MALAGKDVSPEKKTGFTYLGREIVLSKTRGRPMTGKGIFGLPDSKRIEVATLWAVVGNIKKVAELSGLNETTIRKWTKEDWFKKLLEDIRTENDEKIDSQTTEIVDKALDAIKDRIENGDFQVTKTGEIVRKPVAIRDLAIVAAISIDKRQLLRGKPTSRTESVSSEKTLENLASTFAQLAGKTRKPLEIQDVEYKEVTKDGQEPPTEQ